MIRALFDGQVVVRNEFIGVNFIDTYFRTGLYKRDLPTGLGEEGAGTVDAVGEGRHHHACAVHVPLPHHAHMHCTIRKENSYAYHAKQCSLMH